MFEKPATTEGWAWWLPPKGSSARGVQPLHLVQGMSVPTGLAVTSPFTHSLCFLIPNLTLSSCPLLTERINQSGSCCSSAGSDRKTCQNFTKQQGNMSRFGLGGAQAASEEHWLCKAGLPLACWQPALSPLPSFPSAHSAWLYQWLSLLNGRHILLQTWAD